ncbi:MAG: TVP38/TMEM64 family protein [Candidatus Hodarchaeales archaeon]|jgi:uncharacterized membrane protein YdjX (TVP38/TMEM64 family)
MKNNESPVSSDLEKNDKNIIIKWINTLLIAIKRTFTGHTKTTWVWIILFLIIFVISGLILVIQVFDETWLFDKVIRWFVKPIVELKELGVVFFIVFMAIQGILVPIPSELVLLCSGLVWDIYLGSILGIIGSMAAGVLTYYIAVLGGRPMVERFLGHENLEIIDSFIDKYGAGAIIAARAFPFMSFDPISYASGFLKIKFRTYFIATFIGSIVRCVFYAWLGSTLNPGDISTYLDDPAELQRFINEFAPQFNLMFAIIIVVLGSAYLFYQFILMPYLKKKHFEAKNAEVSVTEKV